MTPWPSWDMLLKIFPRPHPLLSSHPTAADIHSQGVLTYLPEGTLKEQGIDSGRMWMRKLVSLALDFRESWNPSALSASSIIRV